MSNKTCSSCNQQKPLTDFYRDKKNADGRTYKCKTCSKHAYKEYRDANLSLVKERRRVQRLNNIDAVRAQYRKYQQENRDSLNKNNAKYREANPEKVKAIHRSRREELSDCYIKQLLAKQFDIDITHQEIPSDLVESKRQEIILSRTINPQK